MGENIKRNVLLLVVVVIAALLVLACADPGIPPGTKIRIRSGSPAPRGSELASHTGVPDSDSDSNISDTDPNPTPAPVSMKASEELVKKVLLKSEQTWNEKDTKGYLSLFSEDARIMVRREQKIVSKADYVRMFPDAFDKAGTVKYDSLSVDILDAKTAKAEGVASISADNGIIWLIKKLRLVNQGDKWLISESFFDIYFKGDIDPRDRIRPRSGGESPD